MRSVASWVVLALVAAGARAEASTFKGTVRDTNGSPGQALSGIPVLVWRHGGGWSRTVASGPDGYWECVAPDGFEYNLACNKSDQSGFQVAFVTAETDNVALSQDTVANFDLAGRPLYDARVTSVQAPSVLRPGEQGTVTIAYENTGQNGWDAKTRIGLSNARFAEPGRGGTTPLQGPSWIAADRPCALSGSTGTFTVVGPSTPGTYVLYLELVEENVAWFDGPGDNVTITIQVPGGTAPALHRVGVDGNQLFNADGSQAIDVPALSKLGAKVVRVNFISGPWNGPGDTTLHAGKTWAQATDEVVNELRGAGIGVYGLLNDELVGGMGDLLRDQSDPKAARAWIETFAQACEQAVGQLKDRVAVFEVMNEPNDWAGGTTARVSAYWQALVLERVYERVKVAHATDPSWQVTLLAGPEFSSVQTLGDGYLQDVFQEGVAHHGWSALLQSSGTYPLDGVAYHIYELQDAGDQPSSVASTFGAHLDAIYAVLQSQDPGWASKKIWISEFGWQSSTAGEQHQADMIQAGFDALLADSRVAVAIDFCAFDFPGTTWGIVGKVAASTFQANAGR